MSGAETLHRFADLFARAAFGPGGSCGPQKGKGIHGNEGWSRGTSGLRDRGCDAASGKLPGMWHVGEPGMLPNLGAERGHRRGQPQRLRLRQRRSDAPQRLVRDGHARSSLRRLSRHDQQDQRRRRQHVYIVTPFSLERPFDLGIEPHAAARYVWHHHAILLHFERHHSAVPETYGQTGEPIRPEQGYPFRLLVPGGKAT